MAARRTQERDAGCSCARGAGGRGRRVKGSAWERNEERAKRKGSSGPAAARTHQDVAGLQRVGERHPDEVPKHEHEPEPAVGEGSSGQPALVAAARRWRAIGAEQGPRAPVGRDVHGRQDRGLVRDRVKHVDSLPQAHLQEGPRDVSLLRVTAPIFRRRLAGRSWAGGWAGVGCGLRASAIAG